MKKCIVVLLLWGTTVTARAGTFVTFVVTNNLDSGSGSLRAAISNALTVGASDTVFIDFNIPTGGVTHTISLLSPLPAITNQLFINGTTQPGYTNFPLIKVDGNAVTNIAIRGFRLYGGSNHVRGIYVTGFTNNSSAIEIAQKGSSVVDGCYVVSNYQGILINNVANNIIGGGTTNESNVIGANRYDGLEISGEDADNNLVAGNYIGVQPVGFGMVVLSNNVGVGVYLGDSNIIRGSATARQIISGSRINYGVTLQIGASQNRIEGNYIGTDITGTAAVPNGNGVYITSADNIVGGTAVSNRNVISGNLNGEISVSGSAATGNQIAGNYVCVNAAGTAPVLPTTTAISIQNASSNFVTGSASAPQLIAGSEGVCVSVSGPDAYGNVVVGNTIGLNASGQVLTNFNGINLYLATGTRVGGPTVADRNIVVGTRFAAGISVFLSTNSVVQGNYVGVDAGGSPRTNFSHGISIVDGTGNLIGGGNPGEGNIISGNKPAGIFLQGTVSNRIQGNFIGTSIAGTFAVGNAAFGIVIEDSPYNWIGGTNRDEGNLISGNLTNGVSVTGTNSHHNVIAANFIGTDVSGMNGISNRNSGIVLQDAQNNTIGGPTPGERNIISGNANNGIELYGLNVNTATGNVIIGNYFGLASNGVSKLGNGRGGGFGAGIYFGVLVRGNTIGGPAPGARNIFGDNTYGLVMQGGHDNLVQGNYIGLDVSGSVVVSNRADGIYLEASHNNRVLNNVISGNAQDGIKFISGSTSNIVQSNRIGPFASGVGGPGNRNRGMLINSGEANLIGGTNPAQGNIIAFNADDGVAVFTNNLYTGGFRNSFLGNLIYSNGFPIDLSDDGVTANDAAPDADAGPNNYQNFPAVTNALQGSTVLQGRLVSGPSQTYRCEFFAINVPQGAIFLGATNLTTGASGTNLFTNVVLPATAPTGSLVIATATDTNGNSSELSPGVVVKQAVDTDGDGLWDTWEQQNFGSLALNGSGDNDVDGRNNYYEFVSDTQPTNAASFFRLASITNGLPHHPSWLSSAARWYDVEFSTNLLSSTWSNLVVNIAGVGGPLSVPDSSDQTDRFYRVRAKIP